METLVEGIYAIGDIVDSPFLAHVASKEGLIAAENALVETKRLATMPSQGVYIPILKLPLWE